MMPITRSKSKKSKQVDMAVGEGTSKSPPRYVGQSKAQDEFASQTSSTPPSLKELRRRGVPPESPINATEQDLRNVVQLLTCIVVGQGQGQPGPTMGSTGVDRAASLQT